MGVLKALFAAIVAVSLAMPPVAAAEMRADAPDAHAVAVHSECCPSGQDCGKPAKGDCGHDAMCTLKCASVSPALAAAARATPRPLVLASATLPDERIAGRSTNPPLPPPRI